MFAEEYRALWSELIKVLPSLCWFLLSAFVIWKLLPLLKEYAPKLSKLKIGDFEMELSEFKKNMASAVAERITIAEKHPSLPQLFVSEKDKDQLISRIEKNLDILKGARILMFDDRPDLLKNERKMLENLGIHTSMVTSLKQAEETLKVNHYDLMISDIDRPTGQPNGIEAVKQLRVENPELAVIFYISAIEPDKGTPPYAFGITNKPTELVHLIIDVLQRKSV